MVNLRFAFRMLFKAPFVTTVAIISLALGIGANAAIFSLFNQVLMRPLPVERPGELVNLGSPGPKPGSQSCGQPGDCDSVFSYPMFRDLEKQQTVLTGIAAHVFFGANLAYNSQTTSGTGALVSGSYFPVLGLRPAAGRLLSPSDDLPPGEPHVVVLSHAYWQTGFAGRPDVVGEKMTINGQSMSIVGVAPEGFRGTTLGSEPKVFVPISMRAQMIPFFKGFDNRRSYWAYLFGRLKPGVTIDQARASLNGQYQAIINGVEAAEQKGMSEATLAKFKAKVLTLENGSRGQSDVHTEAQAPLTLLFSVTGVVLLIACANIANLLLARSAARSGEMAVRSVDRREPWAADWPAAVRGVPAGGARRPRRLARRALDAGRHRGDAAGRRHRIAVVLARSDDPVVRGGAVGRDRRRSSGCSPPCTARGPIWRRRSRTTRASRPARSRRHDSATPWSSRKSRCRWHCWRPPACSRGACSTSAASISASRSTTW